LKNSVLYLCPRGFGNPATSRAVLSRLDLYSKSYAKIYGENLKTTVLLGSSRNELDALQDIGSPPIEIQTNFLGTTNLLKYLLRTFNFVHRNRKSIRVLIPNDPWIGTICGLFYSKIYKIPLQLHVHGDLTKYKNSPKFFDKIKHRISKITANTASTIRLVSEHQKAQYEDCFPSSIGKTFISPIPILIPENRTSVDKTLSVGFLGRFHEERGIDLWSRVATAIALKHPKVDFILIGDGDQSQRFKNDLKQIPQTNLHFTGWLERESIAKEIASLKILLITAPNETYGVSMREALISGVFVVALENDATLELARKYPKVVFTSKSEAELVNMVEDVMGSRFPLNLIKEIHSELKLQNSESMKNLAESWRKF
jgi:glycosyltransferase involved in cell wall biosynthesis